MNVEELKRGLAGIADDVDGAPAQDAVSRLAGVEAKARAARRARLAASGVAAATAVAAVAVLAPTVFRDSTRDVPAPPTTSGRTEGVPGTLATVEDGGFTFYANPAGASLLTHVVSTPGSTEASFTFTPKSLDLSYDLSCADTGSAAGRVEYKAFVNGHFLGGSDCTGAPGDDGTLQPAYTFGYGSPEANERGWRNVGLVAGEPVTFTVRTTGDVPDGAEPVMAMALFQAGERVQVDGMWFPAERVSDGRTYALQTARVDDFASVPADFDVDVVASDQPVLVALGTADTTAAITLTSPQLDARYELPRAGGGTAATVDPGETMSFRLASPGHPDAAGKLYTAQYTLVD